MPLDKKVRNSIKTSFVFNIVIIAWFLLLIISSILPSFAEIEDKKTELKEILYSKEQVLEKGIDFQEFRKLSLASSDVDKAFMKKIDSQFYAKNFINKTNKSYKDFLAEKEKEIRAYISSEDFEKKQERIRKVLPTYSEFPALDSDLTNPRFINYIESMFDTFNLEVVTKDVWISRILPVEDKDEIDKKAKTKKTQKDTEIFYTPMEVSILWQKKIF